MKLFYSQTSPFARKVAMFLHVTGLIDECEIVTTTFESDDLRAQNPLGKIPALATDDINLFESGLICEYLDELGYEKGTPSLFGSETSDYYKRQLEHLRADGITGAAVSTVMEMKRTTEKSDYWLERWNTAIEKGLASAQMDQLGDKDNVNIATLAMIACLGYLDFRLPHLNWRERHTALAQWFASFENEAWFKITAPPAA